MENVWFYAEGEKPSGPFSLTDLKNILSRVAGADKALVWRAGFHDWVQAGSVPELAPCLLKPPPLPVPEPKRVPAVTVPSSDTRVIQRQTRVSYELHPWRRYFARTLDMYIFLMVFFLIVGFIFPEFFQGSHQGTAQVNGWGLTILGSAAYVVFETICLNTFGRTFGKWLYGIRITQEGWDPIPFSVALKRSLAVWIRGIGFGIPVISMFTMLVAYRTLTNDRKASWDRDFNCNISHRKLSKLRWLGILIAWSLMLLSVSVLIVFGRRP